MTSAEAAALRDLVLRGDANVPSIEPQRFAKAYIATRRSRPEPGSAESENLDGGGGSDPDEQDDETMTTWSA
jgi:hypothetical protein